MTRERAITRNSRGRDGDGTTANATVSTDPTDPALLSSRAAPIIDRAPLPLVEVQGALHVVSHVNAAFCALVGKSRQELVGREFATIVSRGEECLPLLDSIYETGEGITHELGAGEERKSGSWLFAMWPALDPASNPVSVIIQMAKVETFERDIKEINEALVLAGLRQQESAREADTLNAQLRREILERRDVEEQLIATDREKDQFLAMLAHELRNPLAPIKNAAHVLRMCKSTDPAILRAQEIIERQSDHLAKLVDDLLDVSRIQEGKVRLVREPMDLTAAILRAVDAVEYLLESRRHCITVDLQQLPRLWIDADPTRVDQVLTNLLGNAIKYTPPSRAEITISASREDETVVIRVRDNGIGIDSTMLARVFDLFSQAEQSLERSQGGLGLGLKLVKELVELHGGTVEAKSEGLGKGSEFVVRLAAVEPPLSKGLPTAAPATQVRPRRVLVVDDNLDTRETMAMILSMSGHSVELAEDGEVAVAKALAGDFDIAFVDIGLPKRSGYDVARAIRQHPGARRIVLVAISGYGRAEDKRKALEAGFDAHLTKPVGAPVIAKILEDIEAFPV